MNRADPSRAAVDLFRSPGALLTVVLTIAALCAIFVTLLAIVPLASALALLAMMLWLSVPGLLFARWLYRDAASAWGAALLVGAPWGYVLSSTCMLALWACGIRSLPVLLIAPLPAAGAAYLLARLAPPLTIPRLTRQDLAAIALVLLTVPATVGLPFARVGEDTSDGRAYRAYFTADFVWQMAVASEVAKGDMLPKNPYHLDDPLRYYWLVHLVPSAVHRATSSTLRVDQPLLFNGVWSALGFMAFLYFFTRHFTERPWAAALACTGVVFCSSFEGAERLWAFWLKGVSQAAALEATRTLNIDAITGWVYGSLRIDGLHRLLLYQPQHQVGYLLGFSALLLLMQAGRLTAGLLCLAGGFLGLSLLISPFGVAIFGLVVALYALWRILAARRWDLLIVGPLAAAVPLGLAFLLTQLLAYADPEAQVIALGLNPLAATRWVVAVFLSFGPVLLIAAVGVMLIVRAGELRRFIPLLITLTACFAFYFWVDVPDVQGVYVGFHVGKIAFAAFVPIVAFVLQRIWEARPGVRIMAMAGVGAIALLAAPTVLIDLYNTQDITNRQPAPFGGEWTLVLSHGELETLDWIKRATPASARVQVEPIARQRGAWAYVPAFAERRMAAGMPTSMVPLSKYERVSDEVKALYESASAKEAHERATSQCIDYVLVGEPERSAYPAFTSVLEAGNGLFMPAYRNGVLDVYAVMPAARPARCDL